MKVTIVAELNVAKFGNGRFEPPTTNTSFIDHNYPSNFEKVD